MKLLIKAVLLVFVAFVAITVWLAVSATPSRNSPASSPPRPAEETVSAEEQARIDQEQADRQDMIDRLQDGELFGDLRVANGVGKVVVGPRFMALPFEEKKTFIGVAIAWCQDHDPNCDLVKLYEPVNNHVVGEWSKFTGFEMH